MLDLEKNKRRKRLDINKKKNKEKTNKKIKYSNKKRKIKEDWDSFLDYEENFDV